MIDFRFVAPQLICFGCLIGFTADALPQESSNSKDTYRISTKDHGDLEVKHLDNQDSAGLVLQVTYKPKGGTEKNTHRTKIALKELKKSRRLEFKSIVDKGSGLWCVYDTTDAKFVFIATPPTEKSLKAGAFKNFWHPGIHIGWARGIWIKHYRTLRETYPSLPYKGFVSERHLAK